MTTQQFIPIEDIKDDLVILKDGGVAMVIQTSAVNFDLLSQNEQMAIIGSFAALLNSLSFSIQIVIRSKRLDISSYLETLKKAENIQTNPLLKMMMTKYRNFVSSIIRENEVLDKQFYVCLSISPLELGLVKKSDQSLQKAITLLIPRRDHIIRQLSRIGLKANPLNSEKLVNLFYDIYNESVRLDFTAPEQVLNINPNPPTVAASPTPPTPQPTPNPASLAPSPTPVIIPNPIVQKQTPAQPNPPIYQQRPSRNIPFVVEELPDEYHHV